MSGTSERSISPRARIGIAGALIAAAVTAVGLTSASSGAQEALPVVSSIASPGTNGEQRMSADGDVVVFESTDNATEPPTSSVVVHVRSTGTTTVVAGDGAQNPAVSDNGCIVTYSTFVREPTDEPDQLVIDEPADGAGDDVPGDDVPGDGAAPADLQADDGAASTGSSTLVAIDRCADEIAAVAVAERDGMTEAFPAAAVSDDGTFIAYSTGDDIVRARVTDAGTYVPDAAFDASTTPSDDVATGTGLDITPDGATIVFEAGLVSPDAAIPTEFGIWSWTAGPVAADATIALVATSSTSPSVSDDGALIAFESAPTSDTGFAGVVVQTAGADGASTVNISVEPFGAMPQLSGDGNHVVFNDLNDPANPRMSMVSAVGDDPFPFVAVEFHDLSGEVDGAPSTTLAISGPVVSRLGDVVAFDAPAIPGAPVTDARLVSVRTLPATGALDSDSYDLGQGDVGEVLAVTSTFRNAGPSSMGFAVDAVAAESPFVVTSTTCLGSLRPQATCTIEIGLPITELEDVFGSITLTALDGSTWSAELGGLGAVATTTSAAPAQTTPPNTTRTSTVDTTRNTTVNTTRTTTRNTTRTTTRNTTSNTNTNTTTLPDIDLPPVFAPTSFEFAPTIAGAGVRTASLEIVNSGGSTEALGAAAFQPADAGFSVVDTTCSSITVGARCVVNIAFAPTGEGALSAELVATFASGTEIRATVTGVGAPPPTLTAIPSVASSGQVVTVQGAGFPAGSTVSLTFGSNDTRDVVVNDSGVFNLPLVVLPNTASGPLVVSVAAQADTFGDVEGELLVTRSSRSTTGVLGGFGANVSR